MIAARPALHGLMLLNPLLVCAAVMRFLSGHFDLGAENLRGFAVMAAAPTVSAQLATALCWKRIEARAAEQRSGAPVGIAIALLTHLIFAMLGAVPGALADPDPGRWLERGLVLFGFLFAFSLALGGVLSLPLSALAAHWAAAQRAKELGHAAA